MNEDGAALFVGDCYSSVTEEETSLAEDEASLSAVSLGGNTTTSVGGATMASSKEGMVRCPSRGSDAGVRRTSTRDADSIKDAELKAAPPPFRQTHTMMNAMQQHEKASDYNSLNFFLGSLHKERQQRQSMQHSSPHRRGSSYHSLGSMGVHSNISGTSHQSCPNYAMMQQVQMENTPNSGDIDVDMEGPTGSISSVHGSQSNSVNTNQSGHESKESGVPKWKRKVNLPSHTSLF
jgi:hypothetical protein